MIPRIEQFTWEKREITVILPRGYFKSPQQKYPAVITQDSDYLFKHYALFHYPEVIFIGVSPIDRNTEYVPWDKKTNVGHYKGEADLYLQMLTQSFIPFLLDKYRIDCKDIALSGASFGGLVSLYALFNYTNYFKRYILLSPSLWYPGFLKYIQENLDIPHEKKIFWYVGGAEALGRNNVMGKMVPNNKQAVHLVNNKLTHPDSQLIFMTNTEGIHRHRFFKKYFAQAVDIFYHTK